MEKAQVKKICRNQRGFLLWSYLTDNLKRGQIWYARLATEVRRYKGIPEDERKCVLGDKAVVEDEFPVSLLCVVIWVEESWLVLAVWSRYAEFTEIFVWKMPGNLDREARFQHNQDLRKGIRWMKWIYWNVLQSVEHFDTFGIWSSLCTGHWMGRKINQSINSKTSVWVFFWCFIDWMIINENNL